MSRIKKNSMSDYYIVSASSKEKEEAQVNYTQWATSNGVDFVPTSKTIPALPSGVYEIRMSQNIGLYFKQISARSQNLIQFPDTNTEEVIEDIQKFWESEEDFVKHNLIYKRGILLYGPPGSGKSCTIQMVMNDVIERNGVVISFTDPEYFVSGMRCFRDVHPDTPVVVIMEDIDSIISEYSESEILNILDGTHDVSKIVFLATTNYPDRLGERLINRPSRFDRRLRIGLPSSESRGIYLNYLLSGGNKENEKQSYLGVDINKWIADTDELTISHIKELFIQVVIMGVNYDEALDTLKNMGDPVEDRNTSTSMGFGGSSKTKDYYN